MRGRSLLVLLLSLASSGALADPPAFPGAVGFGANATGGRGGAVIFVTNTNDSGPGSLRAALDVSGARTIIFRTGGTIDLTSNLIIRAGRGDVTLAGQTAPGGGIALRGAALTIVASNVIVRGIKVRPGDGTSGSAPENRDGIQIENDSGGLTDVIVDHCSVTWAIDETLCVFHPNVRNITISHAILSEALSRSLHPSGEHSKGPLFGNRTSNITLYGNLISHNTERNPKIVSDTTEMINNVVYDRAKADVRIGDNGSATRINIIGNVFVRGPSYNSAYPYPLLFLNVYAGTQVYEQDNLTSHSSGLPIYSDARFIVSSPPFAGTGISARPSGDVFDWVIGNVGPRPGDQDPVDARIIAQAVARTGKIIDSPTEVGGWPPLAAGTAPIDSDDDGMPDSWEIARGLAADDPSDAQRLTPDGYTNLEHYLNSFYTDAGPRPQPPANLRIVR